MTVKYIDTYSKKWSVALVGVLSFAYCIFALPFHIPMAIYAIHNIQELMSSRFQQDRILTILLITSLFLSLFIIVYSIRKQRKNIKAFTSRFSELDLSNPQPQNTVMNRTGWGYMALDTKKGTLLYINHPDTTVFNFFFPKDVRVMGFGMYDWKSIEVEGNTLRIYTGNPELPSITIATGKANQLYEKINAMRNQTWTYEYSIPGYVEHQAKRIADAQGLNLILPPK
ncbi:MULTISPECIES: plasmid IncI1-type surface exclusion protein ExcA [unclassified Serratia (in: enterobacteria)]|uniref:plasmid IncI1-type surface exclusion protein ExcA n=1 Tax=unclassified Serratia (in: enterobacteria) TaxID=2647522 RepID=UPI003075F96B